MRANRIYPYWGIVLLLAVFMTNPDNAVAVRVFHIDGSKGALLLALTGVFVVLTACLNRKICIDTVLLLLALRIPVCLVSALYVDTSLISFGRILIQLLIVLAYFVGLQYGRDTDKLGFMLLLASIVITGQVFFTYAMNGLPMSDPWYSYFMNIPYGGSNVIASVIMPSMFVLLELKKPRIPGLIKCILFFFMLIGLYLTSSRGAVLVFLLLFPVYVIFRMPRVSKWRRLSMLVVLILLYLIAAIGYVVIDFGGISGDFNGRFALWENALNTFARYPLFGGGMVYTGVNEAIGHDVFSGTHNVILETLRESGLIGCVLFTAAVVYILLAAWHGISGKEDGLLGWILLTMFADMLFEGSYFNYTSDTLFWTLAGVLMSKAREQRNQSTAKILTEGGMFGNG